MKTAKGTIAVGGRRRRTARMSGAMSSFLVHSLPDWGENRGHFSPLRAKLFVPHSAPHPLNGEAASPGE